MVAKRKHHFPEVRALIGTSRGPMMHLEHQEPLQELKKLYFPWHLPSICQPAQWAELPPCDLDSSDCIDLEFSKGNVKVAQFKD